MCPRYVKMVKQKWITAEIVTFKTVASILCKAFTTYVRPMLEYCSPVWSPVAVTLISQLESVQRRFTERLPGFQTLPYDERCALLGLDRLELRRLRADLILCYKIIRGLVLLSPNSFFTFISNSRTRGHSLSPRKRRWFVCLSVCLFVCFFVCYHDN